MASLRPITQFQAMPGCFGPSLGRLLLCPIFIHSAAGLRQPPSRRQPPYAGQRRRRAGRCANRDCPARSAAPPPPPPPERHRGQRFMPQPQSWSIATKALKSPARCTAPVSTLTSSTSSLNSWSPMSRISPPFPLPPIRDAFLALSFPFALCLRQRMSAACPLFRSDLEVGQLPRCPPTR
jgi:hypothetical protein